MTEEPRRTGARHTGVLAAVVGFVAFLLLLPARIDHVDGPGGSGRHCSTHLGWQDLLGPSSCSRWGAALVGVLVGLTVALLGGWWARRGASRPAGPPGRRHRRTGMRRT